MNVPDKVNLLSDAWAFVQAGRQPFSFYTDLASKVPPDTALALREQLINVCDFIDRLLVDAPERQEIRGYARRLLDRHSINSPCSRKRMNRLRRRCYAQV